GLPAYELDAKVLSSALEGLLDLDNQLGPQGGTGAAGYDRSADPAQA
ncbi:MAG: hypothetical protein JRI68_03275, partial [Deltaproteobacteria bacterium]|nr:hypothetical protein [Deltaproteobacteria bacterium]